MHVRLENGGRLAKLKAAPTTSSDFRNISLFPDFIRRAIIGAHKDITNYQIIQDNPESLSLYVSPQHHWDDVRKP